MELAYGSLDEAIEAVKETVLRLRAHEAYAVYADYSLQAATGPTIAQSSAPAESLEGEWTVRDDDGVVSDRFAE